MKDDKEGVSASSSLSEAVKDLAWETLVHHATQGELCFVTARPTPLDYDSPENKKLSLGRLAAIEKEIVDALAMKPNNPSLRCVFSFSIVPSLHHANSAVFFSKKSTTTTVFLTGFFFYKVFLSFTLPSTITTHIHTPRLFITSHSRTYSRTHSCSCSCSCSCSVC